MRIHNSEHVEQVTLFKWVSAVSGMLPELLLLFAIPNGGKRHIGTARKLKAEGVRAGVFDLLLPVPRGEFCGLFIEMKVGKNKLTEAQAEFKTAVEGQGYLTAVCYSWLEAARTILTYLGKSNLIVTLCP